jgi:proteasome lid subunit RPN8/RPN11
MIEIKRKILEEIFSHCLKEIPNEACGILAGRDARVEKVFNMTNTQPSSERYFMKPQEQFKVMKEIREANLEMLAIYHSHVASAAYPSATDVELAFYPEVSYLIISLKDRTRPTVRSFKIAENKIAEEELRII